MANRPAPYTQADVTRALKGAIAAGMKVREILGTRESFRLVIGDNDDGRRTGDSWKDVLDEAS